MAITQISWADSQHGWMSGFDSKRNQGIVLSTENGGRTWHRIATGFDVHGLVRTSVSAGVVDESHGVIWWTRDNGRHWYQAPERMINGEFAGSAQFFFWLGGEPGFNTLLQVRPWPPRGPVPRGCRRIQICYRHVSAGAHAVLVERLSNGQHFLALANVPGGIMAVVAGVDPANSYSPAMFLRRTGRNQIIALPLIAGVRPCSGFGQGPIVDWPEITIIGCVGTTGNETAAWVSEDGGKTWQVYRR